MNRIYRFLSLLVLLMAATVTLFSALANEQDSAGCSSDGALFDDGGDNLIGVGDSIFAPWDIFLT